MPCGHIANLAFFLTFFCMSLVYHPENASKARNDNNINSVPKLYSLDLAREDLGTFWVAFLFCYPQRFWHHVIVILSKCWDASPRPRPSATPDVYSCPTLRSARQDSCRTDGQVSTGGKLGMKGQLRLLDTGGIHATTPLACSFTLFHRRWLSCDAVARAM
jgi:hypothetical protein